MAKSIQDLFKNYKPKELKKSRLIDIRFHKEAAWNKEQFIPFPLEFYSESLIEKFNQLFSAATSYLEGIPLKKITEISNLSMFVIKRVAQEILAGESIYKILKTHIGYKTELGLDFASLKLKMYQYKTNKLPLTTDKGMSDLVNAVYKDYWKNIGITSWNDLLEHVFSKEQIEKWNEDNIKRELDQAIILLREFFQKKKRLPKFSEPEVRMVINLIRTGIFSEFGIESWNDMLLYVFDDTNSEGKKYVGSEGLKIAITELKEDYKKDGKLPIYDNYIGITCAIRRDYWKEYGITSWNGLLTHIFGKINFTNNKYKGDEGFALAIKVLKDFKKLNGRRPTNKDKGIGGLRAAILRGEWSNKGINTWKDMIINVFGEVKSRWEQYTGEAGLKNAVIKLKKFKKKYQRNPKTRDKGLSGVKGAVYRGEWRSYGIKNWSDLLIFAFGENELSKGKYEGKGGLEWVVKILKEFKKKHKKIPQTTDKEMNGIKRALYQGKWKDFGVKSWRDLINYSFNI